MLAALSQQALLATLFLDLAIIAGCALALGALARRVGQAVVVGEIMAGLLLGPSVLGLLPGNLDTLLFPDGVLAYLDVLANVALVLFMFGIGFEINTRRMRRTSRDAACVMSASVLAPAVAAVAIAPALWAVHTPTDSDVTPVQFGAFLAIVFSVTALPVLARIVADARLTDAPLGSLALTVAAMTDLVAWIALAVLTATLGTAHGLPLGAVAVGLVGFLVVLVCLVRPLLLRALAGSWYERHGSAGASLLLLAVVALCAAATTQLGLHPAFGAFALGVACPRHVVARRPASDTSAARLDPLERAESAVRRLRVAGLLLVPVYFMVIGLKVDLTSLDLAGVLEICGLLVVVTVPKVAAAAWAAARAGFERGPSVALGLLLNTRGLTELVVLDIGHQAGVIDGQLFTVLVVVAVLTTAMTLPLLPLALRIGRPKVAGEAGQAMMNGHEEPMKTAPEPDPRRREPAAGTPRSRVGRSPASGAGTIGALLKEVLPYLSEFQGRTVVVKYGGAAMGEPSLREDFARDVALLRSIGLNPVVVHGGGPDITARMEALGVPVEFVAGQRVSDRRTVEIVKTVLGEVNEDIVQRVNHHGQPAKGLCGEGGSLLEVQRQLGPGGEDIGFVGRIDRVDVGRIDRIARNSIPVIASVGADRRGRSYNVNADETAGAVARALDAHTLMFLTDVAGWLRHPPDPRSLITRADADDVAAAVESTAGGMQPKLRACLNAINGGVGSVHIVDGRVKHSLLRELFTDAGIGTRIRRAHHRPTAAIDRLAQPQHTEDRALHD